MGKLNLDTGLITAARGAAQKIAARVKLKTDSYTTISVERAALRLVGIDGIDKLGVPLPNILVEQMQRSGKLGFGASYWLGNAIVALNKNPQAVAEQLAESDLDVTDLPQSDIDKVRKVIASYAKNGLDKIASRRIERCELQARYGDPRKPYLYVIVATGDIHADVIQAKAAVRQGADIIAVIRSTGQSLLDYVPYGATTEGFGGTYATQENFRIMRQALDELGEELGRYIRLTNYCSGLCMPEIAVMGASERLDVMLNDSMYGIIFRDINMIRTFVDQFFSRAINGFAGIIINTGEDNYLTTADAIEKGHTVLASQFINEQFAFLSGLPSNLMGLGHAFEIDPAIEDSFLMEIAQAQLVREIFPDSPIKFMPPTKFMTGNIFHGQVQDALFNAASIMTGQTIHLLGMMTEAVHTPLLMDRALSIQNARYVFQSMRHIAEEIAFTPGGRIQVRASQVLREATQLLEEIADKGLIDAIGKGRFADIVRLPSGGKGLDGVITKHHSYYNPFMEMLFQGGENDAVR